MPAGPVPARPSAHVALPYFCGSSAAPPCLPANPSPPASSCCWPPPPSRPHRPHCRPFTPQDKEDLQFLYDEWAHPYFISIAEFGRLMNVSGRHMLF